MKTFPRIPSLSSQKSSVLVVLFLESPFFNHCPDTSCIWKVSISFAFLQTPQWIIFIINFLSSSLLPWFSGAVTSVCWQSVCGNQECVWVSVSSRSACLAALAEGLSSCLNPPPTLPAFTAQKRTMCAVPECYSCVCVLCVAGLQPLGRAGSSAACCDSSAQQQAAGPRPPCGLPLSGTSCVGQQPLLPLSHPPTLRYLCIASVHLVAKMKHFIVKTYTFFLSKCVIAYIKVP